MSESYPTRANDQGIMGVKRQNNLPVEIFAIILGPDGVPFISADPGLTHPRSDYSKEFNEEYWRTGPGAYINNVMPEPIIFVVPQKQFGLERLNNFHQQQVEEANDYLQDVINRVKLCHFQQIMKRVRSYPKNQIRKKNRHMKTITLSLLKTRDQSCR